MTRYGDRKKYRAYEGCSVTRETDKAILVLIPRTGDSDLEEWIPKGQIHDDSEVYEAGTEGKLVISQWIAEQKNIREEGCEYEPR